MTLAKRATITATATAALLTIIKLTIGLLSGSVAILASAIDSILDMFVSIFNMFAVHNSEKPADEIFNYGRSKIEALASVIEGAIIFISGIFILYQAVSKALTNDIATHLDWSLYVMIISFIVTLSLVLYLNYVANKTNSMVIKADALHYKTDLWTNGAVLLSLIIIYFTDFYMVDSIIGGLIAIYIAYSAYELIKDGILILLDKSINEEIVTQIKQIVDNEDSVTSYHHLKTREAGNHSFVEIHLVFHCIISLLEAHRASDNIEEKIKDIDRSKEWVLNMHLDPYDDSKDGIGCNSKKI